MYQFILQKQFVDTPSFQADIKMQQCSKKLLSCSNAEQTML